MYVILRSVDCPFSLAIYKAAYPFGGYMSDVIAAVDQVLRYTLQKAIVVQSVC